MDITLAKINDKVVVVKILGRLDMSAANKLKETFSEYLKEYKNFVFDCSEMDFIDSTGLGAFIVCQQSATKASGKICIANLQSKPRMLFEITRAYKIFDVYDNTKSAIESLE